jgi:transposase
MLWTRGKAHAQDLRERVFAASDAGLPVGRIAETLFVSISYVSKVLSRHRRTGERTARPQRCHVPRKLSGYLLAIQARVEVRPDETIAELRTWLLETHQVSASATLMWETLEFLDLTLKKRPCTLPNRTVPTLSKPGPSGVISNPASTQEN